VILEAHHPESAVRSRDRLIGDDLDGLLLAQPILDQVGDRADLQLVTPCEAQQVVAPEPRVAVLGDPSGPLPAQAPPAA